MKLFDIANCPLKGMNLIEASAGTGKTYTITQLFLRLLLHAQISANQILMVTYTNAATEELRHRIRRTLTESIAALASESPKNPLEGVVNVTNPKTAKEQLILALRVFDEIPIFTIHGFCQRILRENAFESGKLFDTELVPDQHSLASEIVDDYWRKTLYRSERSFIRYIIEKNYSPEKLLDFIIQNLSYLNIEIIPNDTLNPFILKTADENFAKLLHEMASVWAQERDVIDELLRDKRFDGRKLKNISELMTNMDDWIRKQPSGLFEDFAKFTPNAHKAMMKKSFTPPPHIFFNLCEQVEPFFEFLERRLIQFKREAFYFVRRELTERKLSKNIQCFDDLLLDLYHAAKDPTSGGALKAGVRRRYHAALIDEFQDTDGIQWEIFQTLFQDDEGSLFLIGDPKQSIYGFRGADIHAYMKASRAIDSRFTLPMNYRSDSELIKAINTLFSHPHPFVFDAIEYKAVEAGQRENTVRLTMNGRCEPALHLWFFQRQIHEQLGKAKNMPLSKNAARDMIGDAVACEIARLLNHGANKNAMIGDKPIQPSDIVVIVRSHRDAALTQKQLAQLQIPSVIDSSENVFHTEEAEEMTRILRAVAEPSDMKLIKAALCASMIGFQGNQLYELAENEPLSDRLLTTFRQLHEIAINQGFMQMYKQFLHDFKTFDCLLDYEDGDRRLTNALHLAEALQKQSLELGGSLTNLLKWLIEQRSNNAAPPEEWQIRLENDENAVKIVTIHKSKGLEYPIVFVPFLWHPAEIDNKADFITFHDKGRRVLALGAQSSENIAKARREIMAENLRMLYVAITRAKYRVYLTWGWFNKAETSSPAYLFHHHGDLDAFFKLFDRQSWKNLSEKDMIDDLQRLEKLSDNTINLQLISSAVDASRCQPYIGMDKTAKPLHSHRSFHGVIPTDWRVSSFSSLLRVKLKVEEQPDYDSMTPQTSAQGTDVQDELQGIFAFPKGARAGVFLHEILEMLDFLNPDNPTLILTKLNEHGFEESWAPVIQNMIDKLLRTPLAPEDPELQLAVIPNAERLNELSFYFPVASISTETLRAIFADFTDSIALEGFPEKIEKLNFYPSRGFMKGFIDMVFRYKNRYYLVDWKSNYLGASVKDYCQAALKQSMSESYYILQYHLYVLALHQYLTLRLTNYNYEIHFGGVFYIYLRGANPAYGPNYGIFRDRPKIALIEALKRRLIIK
jgi:exodeoxyribonuclease V beta subunit